MRLGVGAFVVIILLFLELLLHIFPGTGGLSYSINPGINSFDFAVGKVPGDITQLATDLIQPGLDAGHKIVDCISDSTLGFVDSRLPNLTCGLCRTFDCAAKTTQKISLLQRPRTGRL